MENHPEIVNGLKILKHETNAKAHKKDVVAT